MKRNRIYIILFIVLAGIAVYLYLSRSSSTIKQELRDFAIRDTASIDKIFIADMQGKTALLERNNGGWRINDKYTARQDAVNTILQTVRNIEVRSPVGKNLYNNTMKLLASNAIKVEFYSKGDLLKTYYVGHATMDNLGTFMYLEGSSVPFIMHIPGFNGYLTTRFFTNENDWRYRSVFAFHPGFINSISVKDPVNSNHSFMISKTNDSTYALTVNGETVNPDKRKLFTYLAAYSNTNYERIEDGLDKTLKDSLKSAGPFKEITVKGSTNDLTVSCYRRPARLAQNKTDGEGKPVPFDRDRLYIQIAGDSTWYLCQYYSWDKLLKTPDYFIAAQTGVE